VADREQEGGVPAVALRAQEEEPGLGIPERLRAVRDLGETVAGDARGREACGQDGRREVHRSFRGVAVVHMELPRDREVRAISHERQDAVHLDPLPSLPRRELHTERPVPGGFVRHDLGAEMRGEPWTRGRDSIRGIHEVTSRGERIVRNHFERTYPAAVATDPFHAQGSAARRVLLQSIEHAERGRGGVSVPDEEHSSGAVALAGHRETWGKVPIDPIVDGLLAHGG
jgi:hypothetical protein